jgi:UDP-hydrolysing UDP-N-acetyl-D-glucosamine 2-epimerase
MRVIAVATVARSDYGIYRPILRLIAADPELTLRILAGGMHLSPDFGMTVNEIEADGFVVAERVEMLLSSDSPEGVAKSTGIGLVGFAQALARVRPDILLVLGDRFEMFAAAAAALPFHIPTAHIHGGESTEGLIDEAIRHSITKMSHLHFASTATYARRIEQLGEEPWRVLVSGAPGLDDAMAASPLSRDELAARCDIDLTQSPLLVTLHPVTLEHERTPYHVSELLAAVDEVGGPAIFTYPNADTSGRLIIQRIEEFCATRPWAGAVANLGSDGYFALMRVAAAMVGNSSSGIIEAASFGLPVVNIGNRQRGRLRPANVIDVDYPRESIVAGIRRAVSSEFRVSLAGLTNPYGDGHASERIVAKLKEVPLDDTLLLKRFHEVPVAVR